MKCPSNLHSSLYFNKVNSFIKSIPVFLVFFLNLIFWIWLLVEYRFDLRLRSREGRDTAYSPCYPFTSNKWFAHKRQSRRVIELEKDTFEIIVQVNSHGQNNFNPEVFFTIYPHLQSHFLSHRHFLIFIVTANALNCIPRQKVGDE